MTQYIQNFEIAGFRSLRDFSTSLARGINVLVGPNGSGKTSFIEALQFLKIVIRDGATQAVNEFGGHAKAFSIMSSKRGLQLIKMKVTGVTQVFVQKFGYSKDAEYTYEIEIVFLKKQSSLYIRRERITCKNWNCEEFGRAFKQGNHFIEVRRFQNGSKFKLSTSRGLLSVDVESNPLGATFPHRSSKDEINYLGTQLKQASEDRSILKITHGLYFLLVLNQILTRNEKINIIPDTVRDTEKFVGGYRIKSDGAGLASMLYLLKNSKKYHDILFTRGYKFDHESFDQIRHWTTIVNQGLTDIDVIYDIHTGSHIVSFWYDGNKPVKVPLKLLSDGTVKWLALITASMLSSGIQCIEEPENFLHPQAQILFLDIMREISSNQSDKVCIVSTHSETIVNSSHPSELIIFDHKCDRTTARRIENAEMVQNEINKTGFGLGFYYASGALQ